VNVLGLAVAFEIPERRAAAVKDNGEFTIFLEQSAAGNPGPACVLCFRVDSVDESYARMTEQGVQFALAPARQFWGSDAELADPEGYRVRLWDGPR
jgi:uncharacterized glyoxalase superfamily protein PhnB